MAAQTEREVDYELLTELLVCKIEKGKERKVDASLNHAVDIVNEVDDDALCALTVAHSIGAFYPANGDILKGIEKYDELYATLLCYELPKDDIWLEHLETLNLVRISNFGRMLKFEEILYNGLEGYVCVGIRKDSEEFLKASNILKCVGFSDELLVDHSLLEGYVRLPFVRRSTIKNLRFVDGRLINVDEIQALNDVWDLYSKDAALVNQVKKDFISEIEKNRNLKIVKEWWNKIALNFHIKQSGKVLAHVNAKRLNEKVPDLI